MCQVLYYILCMDHLTNLHLVLEKQGLSQSLLQMRKLRLREVDSLAKVTLL
jgi:hypothetical protein